jgi:hypothetical protein
MMLRGLRLTACLLCGTVSAATAAGQSAPQAASLGAQFPFHFRSLHVGAPRPTGKAKEAYRRCEKLEATLYCSFPMDMRIADIPVFGEAMFAETGFSEMRLSFGSKVASDVRSALIERYGDPCATSSGEVQNLYGAKFIRKTASWCFSHGIATFQSAGATIGEGAFRFASTAIVKRENRKLPADF